MRKRNNHKINNKGTKLHSDTQHTTNTGDDITRNNNCALETTDTTDTMDALKAIKTLNALKLNLSTQSGLSDIELLKRICNNDHAAFDVVFNKYHQPIKAYAFTICGPMWMDDVVQDTFLKLIQNPPIVLAYDSLAPWLFRVTRNLAIDHVRRNKRLVYSDNFTLFGTTSGDDDGIGPCGCGSSRRKSPANMAMLHSDAKLAMQLLEQLPSSFKEVFVLFIVKGVKIKDIARRIDIPEGTVLWRIHKARKMMTDILLEYL